MWEIYDKLIMGIPEEIMVDWLNIGNTWTEVKTKDNLGLSMTTCSKGQQRSLVKPFKNMKLRELAYYAKSWNFLEASLGVAAINAWYNNWEKVQKLPGLQAQKTMSEDLANRKEKDAFIAFQDEISGSKVAVIGHFPRLEEQFAPICELSVLERDPVSGDYPDSACEYILGEQDYIFITGATLVNKTLPRLLALKRPGAKVSLVGPSVPLAPLLFDYGVDNLSGFAGIELDYLDEIIRLGLVVEIFQAGRMVSVDKILT